MKQVNGGIKVVYEYRRTTEGLKQLFSDFLQINQPKGVALTGMNPEAIEVSKDLDHVTINFPPAKGDQADVENTLAVIRSLKKIPDIKKDIEQILKEFERDDSIKNGILKSKSINLRRSNVILSNDNENNNHNGTLQLRVHTYLNKEVCEKLKEVITDIQNEDALKAAPQKNVEAAPTDSIPQKKAEVAQVRSAPQQEDNLVFSQYYKPSSLSSFIRGWFMPVIHGLRQPSFKDAPTPFGYKMTDYNSYYGLTHNVEERRIGGNQGVEFTIDMLSEYNSAEKIKAAYEELGKFMTHPLSHEIKDDGKGHVTMKISGPFPAYKDAINKLGAKYPAEYSKSIKRGLLKIPGHEQDKEALEAQAEFKKNTKWDRPAAVFSNIRYGPSTLSIFIKKFLAQKYSISRPFDLAVVDHAVEKDAHDKYNDIVKFNINISTNLNSQEKIKLFQREIEGFMNPNVSMETETSGGIYTIKITAPHEYYKGVVDKVKEKYPLQYEKSFELNQKHTKGTPYDDTEEYKSLVAAMGRVVLPAGYSLDKAYHTYSPSTFCFFIKDLVQEKNLRKVTGQFACSHRFGSGDNAMIFDINLSVRNNLPGKLKEFQEEFEELAVPIGLKLENTVDGDKNIITISGKNMGYRILVDKLMQKYPALYAGATNKNIEKTERKLAQNNDSKNGSMPDKSDDKTDFTAKVLIDKESRNKPFDRSQY